MICMHYRHLYVYLLFKIAYSIFETQIISSVFILASSYYLILYSSSWNLYQGGNQCYELGEDILIVNNNTLMDCWQEAWIGG